jgi:hypothetical protein
MFCTRVGIRGSDDALLQSEKGEWAAPGQSRFVGNLGSGNINSFGLQKRKPSRPRCSRPLLITCPQRARHLRTKRCRESHARLLSSAFIDERSAAVMRGRGLMFHVNNICNSQVSSASKGCGRRQACTIPGMNCCRLKVETANGCESKMCTAFQFVLICSSSLNFFQVFSNFKLFKAVMGEC